MSEETLSSMHDARDAEDKRLLEAKEHTQLLENYVYLVQEWAGLRVRGVTASLVEGIAGGTCTVVWSTAHPSSALERFLDGDERLRLRRYRRPRDAARFLAGAALARVVLGDALDVDPADVPLRRACSECGRPHGPLVIDGAGISVSAAHSADRVVFAVSASGLVGVDAEAMRRAIDVRVAAPLVFSAEELAAARACSARRFTRTFYETWTRKEALAKGIRVGLRLPFSTFTLAGEGAIRATAGAEIGPRTFHVWHVNVGRGYAAAVAVEDAMARRPLVLDGRELLLRAETRGRRRR